MRGYKTFAVTVASAIAADSATAAEVIEGHIQRQPLNLIAIAMFIMFVLATLGITYWAARRTHTAADFYTAGGGITGFQNGLAIAGDYMSAASFLGISAAVFASGYDGLIYSIGFLVGWPVIMFLMAERLRNLGKFTFADVASYRFAQTPIRALAACGTLVTVAFYLIAQMVGAGQLIELLFGLPYHYAIILVGAQMIVYVTVGGMIATTWVQIIKAILLLLGATFMSFMVHPAALVDFLAGLSPACDRALDCGCGTGQLSVLLAARFNEVIATDASAAHWLDLARFYAEVRRVARPNAVAALITYGVLHVEDPAIDPIVQHFYYDVIGPYWPPERRHVEEGYRTLAFPFREIPSPPLAIEVQWRLSDLLGYVNTWSATKAAIKALSPTAIDEFRTTVGEAWGDAQTLRKVRWPLSLRVGYV